MSSNPQSRTWDDADIKVKSLVYLSLGTEASRIYHQRNLHTRIDRYSTNELIYELGVTFTRPRNITFDRFQLITVQQNSNKNLKTFFSRLRELGSKAALGNVDEDLIKDFFIAKMNNFAIQMELLSEVRTPDQVLKFALSRERGQENQKENLRANPSNWNQVIATTQQTNSTQTRPQTNTQRQQQIQDIQPCWRCGAPFTQGHNINCPAKRAQCNICKNMGHFAKLCQSKMSERPRQRPPQRTPQQSYNQSPGNNQTRRVRHVTEQSQDIIQATTEDENESIDPKATLYLKELTEDWANINLVIPKSYRPVRNIIVSKTQNVEIWIQTTCNNSEKIAWLADTGSRRSFINQSTAKKLMSNNPNIKIERYNEYKRYRCFNNKEIKIKDVIHMDITSGNWIAKKCQILIVEQNTTNLMGRDMLPKLGISLQQTKQQGRQIHHISDIQTKKTLPNGYSKNIHTYVQV